MGISWPAKWSISSLCSGVSLKTDARPPLGEVVLIGQMAGKVVRHHETGIAIEFVAPPAEKGAPTACL